MIQKHKWPVLEYDDSREVMVKPNRNEGYRFPPRAVLFFHRQGVEEFVLSLIHISRISARPFWHSSALRGPVFSSMMIGVLPATVSNTSVRSGRCV